MSEWIDVPVAEVAVGDECRVDGIGKVNKGKEAMSFVGTEWWGVVAVDDRDAHIKSLLTVVFEIRRSSIVAARRRKPEPQPKPGDWRCAYHDKEVLHSNDCPDEWYRASSGWSKDTRTSQPWVLRPGVQAKAFGWGCDRGSGPSDGTWFNGETVTVVQANIRGDFYVRFGRDEYDIHPRNLDLIDRRGKR